MPSNVPSISEEQRRKNLERAMEVRKARAQAKESLRKGEMSFTEAIEDPVFQRIPVKQLLATMPGIGQAKTKKLMTEIGISDNRRVKGLGTKQKQALIDYFTKE